MDRRDFVRSVLSVSTLPVYVAGGSVAVRIVRHALQDHSECPKIAVTSPRIWAADDLPAAIDQIPVLDPLRAVARLGSYSTLAPNRFRVEVSNFTPAEAQQEEPDYCWAAVVESIL